MISTRMRPRILGSTVLGAFALRSPLAEAMQATPVAPVPPSPPTQPASGPGGSDYVYDEVVATNYHADGTVATSESDPAAAYWLFEPSQVPGGSPAAATAVPVVVFVGPTFASKPLGPGFFRNWIDHLVRRGAVVVYPIYTPVTTMIDIVRSQVSAALAELGSGGHTPVDPTRLAVIGQESGGGLAINLIASPPAGLPVPGALMVMQSSPNIAERDVRAILASMHVLVVGGDSEDRQTTGADEGFWTALAHAGRVPPGRRAYVVLQSDAHGSPPLEADDSLALTGFPDPVSAAVGDQTPDALDWYGTWKLLDGLMACAFAGEWCEYAFGNTPEQRFMGVWSDGVPVNEAIVVEDPATPVSS